VQTKLKVNDEEFGQWRFWLWTPRAGFELLSEDGVDVAAKLPKDEGAGFTDTPYLGMEVSVSLPAPAAAFCVGSELLTENMLFHLQLSSICSVLIWLISKLTFYTHAPAASG